MVLELMDIDLCGPMSIVSLLKAHYFMTFTNDYNYYTWVYFIKHNDEFLGCSNNSRFKLKLKHEERLGTFT